MRSAFRTDRSRLANGKPSQFTVGGCSQDGLLTDFLFAIVNGGFAQNQVATIYEISAGELGKVLAAIQPKGGGARIHLREKFFRHAYADGGLIGLSLRA